MKNNKIQITNTTTYNNFLLELKEQIKTSQTRAIGHVNFEMIILYFKIGKALEKKQRDEGWGAKVIERLSIDLHESQRFFTTKYDANGSILQRVQRYWNCATACCTIKK